MNNDQNQVVRRKVFAAYSKAISSDMTPNEIADSLIAAALDAAPPASEPNFCLLIDELLASWNVTRLQPEQPDTPEVCSRRINARLALENAIAAIGQPAKVEAITEYYRDRNRGGWASKAEASSDAAQQPLTHVIVDGPDGQDMVVKLRKPLYPAPSAAPARICAPFPDMDKPVPAEEVAAFEAAMDACEDAAAPAQQEPVAKVDASDDGYFADILPNVNVKIGQLLYAAPIAQPAAQRDAIIESFHEVTKAAALLYDKWENGISCYEEPTEEGGYIGNAFRLGDAENALCLKAINGAEAIIAGKTAPEAGGQEGEKA